MPGQGQTFGLRAEGHNYAATSPIMAGVGHLAVGSDGLGQARKRNVTMAGLESSPGSVEDVEETEQNEDKKRQPVKRACNECRQQKVSSFFFSSSCLPDPCQTTHYA